MNKITGPYSAIVDDKPTGLSGCSAAHRCRFQQRCLRADSRLLVRTEFKSPWAKHDGCEFYIGVQDA